MSASEIIGAIGWFVLGTMFRDIWVNLTKIKEVTLEEKIKRLIRESKKND